MLSDCQNKESINHNLNQQIVKKIQVKNTSYTIIDNQLKHEEDDESIHEFNNLYTSLSKLKNGEVYEILNIPINASVLD